MGGYKVLKSHVFFKDVNWDNLHKEQPPKLLPYLPAISKEDTAHHSNYFVSFACEGRAAPFWEWGGGMLEVKN